MTEILWQDPPTHAIPGSDKGRYGEFADALRENAGRWALLPGGKRTESSARNAAMNIRNGRMKDFPRGQFDATVDGESVYVRYSPDAEANQQDVDPAAVRKWARGQGYDVATRGVVSESLKREYLAATGGGNGLKAPEIPDHFAEDGTEA